MKFSILLALFITLSISLNANEDSALSVQSPVTPTAKETKFIEVSNVTQVTIEFTQELRGVVEQITKEQKLCAGIHDAVKPYSKKIKKLLSTSKYKKPEEESERELQKMQSELSVYMKQLDKWVVTLNNSIDIYDTNTKQLKEYTALWSETQKKAEAETAPKSIIESIDTTMREIKKVSNSLKKEYDKTLTTSQLVSTLKLRLKDTISLLQKSEEIVKDKVFQQNKAPFFELLSQNSFSFVSYVISIQKTLKDKVYEVESYLKNNLNLLIKWMIFSFLTFAFVVYFNYLYRKKKLFVQNESMNKKIFFYLKHPLSTYIVLSLLLTAGVFTQKPKAMLELELFMLIVPVMFIMQNMINKKYYKYLYIFFILYSLSLIEQNSIEHELESRLFMLVISFALFIYLVAIIRNDILYSLEKNLLTKMGNKILIIFIFLLVVAFFANLYGSVLLASRIVDGLFLSIFASMIFYVVYIILTGYIVIILRRRISTTRNILDVYSQKIENTTKILIKIWMLVWWVIILSKILSLYPYLLSAIHDFLALSWQIASTTISVQSIFDFIVIVVGTWALASVSKTFLEVEIFARFSFPRGVPTAIVTTLNYVIVLSGTIIAFSSLGVTPQQFALIFGALGVGIGFGLRNIIANFVSGIIMVFERPVQIGDTIEVEKTFGSVQSIGARSTTLKTFDGSEVIIPNADFMAKEITNWTLSDKHRRKTIEFKVDIESDIDFILELLKETALQHPDILRDPEPIAAFLGFGEYYLEFKLYFWLADNLIVAHSEISREVFRVLQEAGIKMPVNKTELK